MSKRIYISRYEIHSVQGLNSRSHSTKHEGALIRVEIDGVSGYGSLHPWVELGDTNLDQLLLELESGELSRQVKCAVHCAKVDREARARGVNLFDGLDVPDSHATVVGGLDAVEAVVEAGFDVVKLKMGRNVAEDLVWVKAVNSVYPDLRLRLDFNTVLGIGRMESFVKGMGRGVRNQIDFVEDPISLGKPLWDSLRDTYGLKTAVDRGVARADGEFDYSVVKPAVNHTGKVCKTARMAGRKVVVTSYMDHPIGQCYAAYSAGIMNQEYLGLINKRAGLMTHGLFLDNAYAEQLGEISPLWESLNLKQGTGLGFDDLLDKENWQRLV